MYSITKYIDVTPGGEPEVIHVSQYDTGSREINLELFSNDGDFTIPSGATAEVNGTKPDGNGFAYACTIDENTVTFTLTEQMAAVAGRVPCKIVIESSGQKLLTERFILMVDRAALDKDTVSSESEIRQFVEIMDDVDDVIAAAESIAGTVETVNAAVTAAQNAQTAAETAQEAAEDAAESVADDLETIQSIKTVIEGYDDDIAADRQAALNAIAQAKTDALGNINDKAQQIISYTSQSDLVAGQALSKANNLENDVYEAMNKVNSLESSMAVIMNMANNKADNGYADNDGYLQLTSNGEDIGDKIGPFASTGGGGGGGGGSADNARMTWQNNTGWVAKTIANGSDCFISVTWTSLEDETETGPGSLQISVGGIVRTTQQVSQGLVSMDVSPYLSTGSNSVDFRITDVYGNSRHTMFTVTVIAISISSTFDTSVQYDSVIQFPYTPIGAVAKTVYFILDGQEIGTQQTSVSGRQMTYTIPAQSHGGHSILCYFESEINGQTVRSNEIYFEFVSVDPLGSDPIITCSYNTQVVEQYTLLSIPAIVYDPSSLTAEVKMYANGNLVSTQTVDRTEHIYSYKANTYGTLQISFVCGSTTKILTITVTESDVDIEAETENLALYLTSQGRSNNEAEPWTWVSEVGEEDVEAVLTGFNGSSDGWQADEDGITCLRVSGGARVEIPYEIFATDARQTGLTIEIEYATRNVSDYSATVLSCMNGGRGLLITPQSASLSSEQTGLSMQYKEGEHIRVAYTIDKRSEDRLVRSFIDGTLARVTQYPADDDFSQVTPAGISIGSDDCTIDVYCIRIYSNNLTMQQVLENWIADTQDGTLMLERYRRNQVYDDYGQIVIAQLPSDLPYMILEAEELPQYKGDKKTISGSYTDPLHPANSFTFTGCQANVQGTSSAPYYRKNFDLQFKNGFEMVTSGHADKYKLRATSIPTDRFVIKADVASSESANNVQLVRFYNDICPYKTPEMLEDSRVRWGIDGFPIVVFWHDMGTGETKFHGKYNFNFPKRFPAGMGYVV